MHGKAGQLGLHQRMRHERKAHACGHAAQNGVQRAHLHDACARDALAGQQQLNTLAVAAALAKGQKRVRSSTSGAGSCCSGVRLTKTSSS